MRGIGIAAAALVVAALTPWSVLITRRCGAHSWTQRRRPRASRTWRRRGGGGGRWGEGGGGDRGLGSGRGDSHRSRRRRQRLRRASSRRRGSARCFVVRTIIIIYARHSPLSWRRLAGTVVRLESPCFDCWQRWVRSCPRRHRQRRRHEPGPGRRGGIRGDGGRTTWEPTGVVII